MRVHLALKLSACLLLIFATACRPVTPSPTPTATPGQPATPTATAAKPTPTTAVRPLRIQPNHIVAKFDQATFSTTYEVNAILEDDRVFVKGGPNSDGDVAARAARLITFRWTGPNCGTWKDSSLQDYYLAGGFVTGRFVWTHPHPPCGQTTDHSDVTILLGVSDGRDTILCTYDGAGSGDGPECKKQ